MISRKLKALLRKSLKAARIILIETIIILVLLEIILALFFPLKINQNGERSFLKQSLPGVKEVVKYDRNKYGFRSLFMTSENKPPATYRILCIGASTTDQGLQNTEDTWSGLLETALEKKFKKDKIRIEVAAYGRGGEKVSEHYKLLNNQILRFDPDLVITLEGINDLFWNGGPNYSYSGLPQIRPLLSKKSNPWHSRITNLQLHRRWQALTLNWQDHIALNKGIKFEYCSTNLPYLRIEYQNLPYKDKIQRHPDPLFEFQDILTEYISVLRSNNIDVIMLGQPVLYDQEMSLRERRAMWFKLNTKQGFVRPSHEWLFKEIKKYNEVQERIAKEFKITYIDLDHNIPKTLEYYIDDCHFTDLGNQKVANTILPHVEKEIDQWLADR